MSQFTIKFKSRREHDEYCLIIAKRLTKKEEKIINASDFLNSKIQKTKKYKIGNAHQPWAKVDDQFLIEHYGKLETKTIAKHLDRTVTAIMMRAGNLRKDGEKVPYTYEQRFAHAPKMIASIRNKIENHTNQ